MARPVEPGMMTTHRMSKALEPAKQNGTSFADPIRASSQCRLHTKAEDKTAPDQHAETSNCACNAGAIQTRHTTTRFRAADARLTLAAGAPSTLTIRTQRGAPRMRPRAPGWSKIDGGQNDGWPVGPH